MAVGRMGCGGVGAVLGCVGGGMDRRQGVDDRLLHVEVCGKEAGQGDLGRAVEEKDLLTMFHFGRNLQKTIHNTLFTTFCINEK